jgi:hypothetical protein
MATDPPPDDSPKEVPALPAEIVGAADLPELNLILEALFARLRVARRRPVSERMRTIEALQATWAFLMLFSEVTTEGLHIPLLNLHGALLALEQNNVEPLLKPAALSGGGRAPASPAQEKLIGFAAGAVGRLLWTGMARKAAHEAVTQILDKLGAKPGRGGGRVTPRTVRGWCERVAADVGEHSIAATNANTMLTAKWQSKIKPMSQTTGRKFVLDALTHVVRNLINGGDARAEKPFNPSS